MKTTRWMIFAAGVLGATTLASPAHATTMVDLSTEQLVDASQLVVQGTVTEIWTELDDRGWVWTRAQVDVSEVYKGEAATDAVVVDQPGGTWAGRVATVSSTALFSVGEQVVLFASEVDGHTQLVGLSQGKYTVRLDPYSREQIVQQFRPAKGKPYDHRFIPLPAADRTVYLQDFEADIRRFAAEEGVK